MANKKNIFRDIKLWFESTVAKMVPNKSSGTNWYPFREMDWSKGVIIDELVPLPNRNVRYEPSDHSFGDKSLTKEVNIDDWNKRKIIHGIKIEINKNCPGYEEAISYSIMQVKKSMFELQQVKNYRGSFVSDSKYQSDRQIVYSPFNSFFNNSVEFKNLNYDLPADEDLALVQNIQFKDNFKTNKNSIKYGCALKPYVNYEITIIYSNGYI